MPSLVSLVPDAATITALEPSALAGVLLAHLQGLDRNDQNWNRHQFLDGARKDSFHSYPTETHEQLTDAFLEAWAWLENEGLIARRANGGTNDWYVLTRRGARVRSTKDFEAYRVASRFPRTLVHSFIVEGVWSNFVQGHYDTAVFEAFRAVEVAVRNAGGFDDRLIGIPLMRKAFDPKDGPLRDHAASDPGEREAMAHLFAGAIGVFKNPTSHRKVVLRDPQEAIEMILLASHLLRIVEARVDARKRRRAGRKGSRTA